MIRSLSRSGAWSVPVVSTHVPMRNMHLPRPAILSATLLLAITTTAQTTFTFVNDTPAPHNGWDSGNNWATAFTRVVNVSGVPTSGMVLRQVNLEMGSNTNANISTLAGRLTDPAGNTVQIFNSGYFYPTDFSRYVTISFRDHPALKRLSDYSNSFLGMPYAFGYYRTEAPAAFSGFNTTTQVNGAWTFAMIENTATEMAFQRVELVFGPPLQVVDITGGTSNAGCGEPYCLRSGANEVVVATNVGYPQGQPAFPPLTLGGCNWNAEANNTAWFRFTASDPVVRLSVSGFGNNVQQTLVVRNTGDCSAPSYTQVGCPWSMFTAGCNTTTGDPLLYHRVCYDGGSKFNHGYTLTGLVPGEEYLLLVDGQSGADATFYIEVASGADGSCPTVIDDPVITGVDTTGPGCDGQGGTITISATGTGLQFSIDGGATFQSSNVFSGLGAGTYVIVVEDVQGLSVSTTVDLVAPPSPVLNGSITTAATCGQQNGSITVDATGDGLLYSIDGGATQQALPSFEGLAAGTYTVLVTNAFGCTASASANVPGTGFPVITAVAVSPIGCAGEADGVIDVTATDPGTLTYSINGGPATELNVFTGLPAGVWTIIVSNGQCGVDTTITLVDPPAVVVTRAFVSDESCIGACDGDIAVEAANAVTFTLDGGAPQQVGSFLDLCPGTYAVVAADANGCAVSEVFTVAPGALVQAAFTYEPTEITEASTPVQFSNSSTGGDTWLWTTGGWGVSEAESPEFTFPEQAWPVTVCLIAITAQNCTDTVCTIIELRAAGELEVPNVFSPNGDGRNDTFGVFGRVDGITGFVLEVYNRYGQLIFQGLRPGEVWDGRQFSGEQVSEGTYFWTLRYQLGGQAVERSGHLTLVR